MDQSRGLADDLIYGRDLDHRPDETPLHQRPEYSGAAGIARPGAEYTYGAEPQWSTSNLLEHPQRFMESNPINPASRPYAGVRTSLAFRSISSEMPEHVQAFVSRDFSELKAVEEVSHGATAI